MGFEMREMGDRGDKPGQKGAPGLVKGYLMLDGMVEKKVPNSHAKVVL
jgi:hypothetical protein